MKVVILAGGFGTRISEESYFKPKPMIEIGSMPILWHIMKIYSSYGFDDFIVCGGYKQHIIKEWFSHYFLYNNDITFDFTNENSMIVHNHKMESWKVTIVDTGINTMTGGRVKRIQQYVKNETFMLTYGDGLANINIDELLETHRKAGKIVTISAVKIRQRFGVLHIEENGEVSSFREKLDADEERVNGGFMVMEPQVFKYIDGDDTVLERDILGRLAEEKEIKAYKHDGFWQPMDTIREREKLEELWGEDGTGAPWKIWDDK